MKRLIVLSVIFALVAGSVFAVDVGVNVFGNIVPVSGSTAKNSELGAGGGFNRVRIEGSGEDESGTFGGYFRFDNGASWWVGGGIGSAGGVGFAWWKPIDQFKIYIGQNVDSWIGLDGVTRWGFYQNAGEVGVAKEGWAFGDSFYGGFGDGGALLAITPAEGFEINIGIPFFNGGEARYLYPKTVAQVAYNIDGIGKIGVTFVGNTGRSVKTEAVGTTPETYIATGADASKLYVYFGLSAIENLGIDIGFGYTLGVTESHSEEIVGVKVETKATYNAPIAAGLGVNFSSGDLGVKFRAQGTFAGKGEWSTETTGTPKVSTTAKSPMVIDIDVQPSYAVSETIAVLLDAGLKMTIPEKGDSVTGWHAMPYVAVKSAWWSPNFWAGFRVESPGKVAGQDAIINWSVPIGIAVAF